MIRFFSITICLFIMHTKTYAQPVALAIPEFTFFKADKSMFTPKNLDKDKLLFFIFFDSDCDHCQRAMQYVSDHYNDFKTTSMYLVSRDSGDKITAFLNSFGSKAKGKKNVTVLMDPRNDFVTQFKPRKYPSVFLFDTDKKLLLYEDNDQSMFRFVNAIKEASK